MSHYHNKNNINDIKHQYKKYFHSSSDKSNNIINFISIFQKKKIIQIIVKGFLKGLLNRNFIQILTKIPFAILPSNSLQNY